MPPRKGMTSDYQQIGFGGLAFATNLNFTNLPMTYEQRLWALEGLYAYSLAKIEDDTKYKEDRDIGMLVGAIRILLSQAGKDYQARFEDHTTMDDDENKYRTLLCQIFEKITQLQGKTKMIERERVILDEIG